MGSLQKEFLEEMRLEYDRRSQTSESLTKKTNNLMTVSGIIATLIMGLYGSLYATEGFQIHEPQNLVLISVMIMIIAVTRCVWLNRVEPQRTVFLGKNFFESPMAGSKVIKSWTDSSRGNYYDALIDEYVKCLHKAECESEKKSRGLNIAIGIFLTGLVSFPILFMLGMVL